jgi:hypothetical protein
MKDPNTIYLLFIVVSIGVFGNDSTVDSPGPLSLHLSTVSAKGKLNVVTLTDVHVLKDTTIMLSMSVLEMIQAT